MYFGTFSFQCQLCTHTHIQHSRHEFWDDKSELELSLDCVHPLLGKSKMFNGFVFQLLVVNTGTTRNSSRN